MKKLISQKSQKNRKQSASPESQNLTQNTKGRVLVVDDNSDVRLSVAEALNQCGFSVESCASAAEALETIQNDEFQCVLTDLQMPGMNGIELIAEMRKRGVTARILMMTAYASISTAVEAIRLGAFDYIEKPCDIDRLERLVSQAVVADDFRHRVISSCLIGSSPAMQRLRQEIARFSGSRETVLVNGESGTGKELVARSLHDLSSRCEKPYVTLNCPVLSAQLMESELFGHKKGAFTGADYDRIGRFEAAKDGTLLLDEISEIDIGLQAKLLRVLQERSYEQVGSSETVKMSARIVATTNRDLEKEIREGRFRQDLYYRLSVLPISVPPLRERKDDICELIEHFLDKREDTASIHERFTESAIALLHEYDWPGNIRQLENVVIRSGVLAENDRVTAGDLKRWLGVAKEEIRVFEGKYDCATNKLSLSEFPVGVTLEDMERQLIEATLKSNNGHRGKTAVMLNIAVRTLNDKMRKYGYSPREKLVHY